jgi:threonine/homoserine/homoserine lactone efflux protein
VSLLFLPDSAFIVASVVVILAPGPDILFVLANGISRGRLTAVIAAGGFASGLSVHTACAVFGLSALLMASPTAFTCVKFAGAGYLIYLGIRALRAHGVLSLSAAAGTIPPRRIFAQAFLMNVLNPKVVIFFLAFLPQFTVGGREHLPGQLLALGICFALLAFGIFSLVGIFSSGIGRWMRVRPRAMRLLDYGIGAIFIAIGLHLALASHH